MFKLFTSVILTLLVFISLTVNITKVKALTSSDSNVTITIDEELNSKVVLSINYLEVSEVKVFESINITLPFNDLENISVSNTFAKFNHSIKKTESTNGSKAESKTESKTTITIELKDKLTSFNLDPLINIEFETGSLITDYFSLKQFFFPYYENDLKVQNIGFSINYPSILGENFTVYTDEYEVSENQITGVSNGGIKVLFGDIDNLTSIFKISTEDIETLNITQQNNSEEKMYLNFNLPFERDYSFIYQKTPTFSYGYIDSYYNNYVLIPLTEDKELNFESVILKDRDILDNRFNNNFNNEEQFKKISNDYFIDNSKKFYIDAKEFIDAVNNPLDKLKATNDYLKNNLSPNLDESISNNNIDLIWEKLSETNKLNSFEYCFLLGSFSKEFNIPLRIVYGYILKDISTPHFWCEFSYENQTYILDPVMEEIDSLTYFKKDNRDRLTYGVWSRSSESTYLGLRSDINSPIVNKFLINTDNEVLDNLTLQNLTLSIGSGITLESSVYNHLDINIFNPNNFFVYPNNIFVSTNSFKVNTIKDDIKLLIPPNSEITLSGEANPGIFLIDYNNIDLNYIIETNNSFNTGMVNLSVYINKEIYKILLILIILLILFIIGFKYRRPIKSILYNKYIKVIRSKLSYGLKTSSFLKSKSNFKLLKNLKSKYTFKTKLSKN